MVLEEKPEQIEKNLNLRFFFKLDSKVMVLFVFAQNIVWTKETALLNFLCVADQNYG